MLVRRGLGRDIAAGFVPIGILEDQFDSCALAGGGRYLDLALDLLR
jgi:hypothetical protein